MLAMFSSVFGDSGRSPTEFCRLIAAGQLLRVVLRFASRCTQRSDVCIQCCTSSAARAGKAQQTAPSGTDALSARDICTSR
jgi:hypothetical protein